MSAPFLIVLAVVTACLVYAWSGDIADRFRRTRRARARHGLVPFGVPYRGSRR